MVDRKDREPPKMGEKSAKVKGPFEKGHCRFRLFVWYWAYFNKKRIIVDFEVHMKKAILKKFQKLTKWKVLRGQRGLNERTWWWIVRTVDLQEWERNHQKWEVHLKKVIVDFDYSFKKRHTSFKKSHCRFCGPFEKAIVELIFLKKSA